MTTYISNSAHYKEVLSCVLHVMKSLWIGTADIKDMLRKIIFIGSIHLFKVCLNTAYLSCIFAT